MFCSQDSENDGVFSKRQNVLMILNMLLQTTLPGDADLFAGGRQPWSGAPETQKMWRKRHADGKEKPRPIIMDSKCR